MSELSGLVDVGVRNRGRPRATIDAMQSAIRGAQVLCVMDLATTLELKLYQPYFYSHVLDVHSISQAFSPEVDRLGGSSQVWQHLTLTP